MGKTYEYQVIKSFTSKVDDLHAELNVRGALGWEVVGVGSNDAPAGAWFTIILKRETMSMAGPQTPAPGWNADPFGRFQQRYWDGLRWTEHVSTSGVADVDLPIVKP